MRGKEELPPGWRVRASRSLPGKFYYVNIKTGETSWTRPDDTTSALAKKQAEVKRRERLQRRAKVIDTLKQQEEKALKELKQLQEQLSSIDSLLQLNPNDQEVLTLRSSLKELVSLHETELLQTKKERLKLQFSPSSTSTSSSSSSSAQASAASRGPAHDSCPGTPASASSSTPSSSVPGTSTSAAAVIGSEGKDRDAPVIVRSSESLLDRAGGGAALQEGVPIVPETRCQAPFSTTYGIFAYHDAIIHAVDDDGQHCTVLFVTPLYESMLACRDYLKGRCTRGESCIHSHGQRVAVRDLRPAAKIDYAALSLDGLCLYRPSGQVLWKYGTLVAVSDETHVVVRPHFGGRPEELPLKNVRPVPGLNVDESELEEDEQDKEDDEDGSVSDEGEGYRAGSTKHETTTGPGSNARREQHVKLSSTQKKRQSRTHDGQDQQPHVKGREGRIMERLQKRAGARMPEEDGDFAPIVMDARDQDFARWEEHSKGIGSKILAKFGYKPGQGLGKEGEGRVNPVKVQVLPQGKSLDYIMNRRLNIQLAKQRKAAKPSVFDFLNQALSHKTREAEQQQQGQQQQQQKRGHSEAAGADGAPPVKAAKKPLNVQIMDLYNEMVAQEREIARFRPTLQRHKGEMRRRAQQTLNEMQERLEDLRRRKSKLEKTTDSKRKLRKFIKF